MLGYGEIPERPKGVDCKSIGYAFAGSNPALATIICWGFEWDSQKHMGKIKKTIEMCGNSSIGRATAFQAVGCEFDPRFPLQKSIKPA